MKHVWRFSTVIVLVVALLVGSVLPAVAQGTPNCNGLSDSDCQILLDSTQAMEGVTALSISSMSASINMQAEGETIELSVEGSGAFILPPNLVALMSDMPSTMTMTDMTPLLDLVNRIDAAFIEEALAGAMLHVVIDNATMNTPDEAGSIGAQAILKDKVFYVELASPNGATSWFGEPVVLTPTDLAELDAELDEMQTQLATAFEDADLQALAELSEQMADVSNRLSAVVNKYVTTTRGADETVDGRTLIPFTTTMDLAGLLADPELAPLLVEMLTHPAMVEMMEESGESMDLSQVNATQVQFVLMTVGLLIKNPTMTLEQWVGADDHYLYRVSAQLGLELDMALFGSDAEQMDPVVIGADFDIQMDDFNAVDPDSVTVPDEYYPLDRIDDFLAGTEDMIEGGLEVGGQVEGELDYDDNEDLYVLELAEGATVTFLFEGNDTPSLAVYGPDGFKASDFEYGKYTFTAGQAGTYLVKVSGYWDITYTLMVKAG